MYDYFELNYKYTEENLIIYNESEQASIVEYLWNFCQ